MMDKKSNTKKYFAEILNAGFIDSECPIFQISTCLTLLGKYTKNKLDMGIDHRKFERGFKGYRRYDTTYISLPKRYIKKYHRLARAIKLFSNI